MLAFARPLALISALAAGAPSASAAEDLQALQACLAQRDLTMVSAHRGGPAPGFPENALETFQRSVDAGIVYLEVDVAQLRDGVLFLMHDSTLDRTTTGSGSVDAVDWAHIQRLYLKDAGGTVTAFHPPSLKQALRWAGRTGAILKLDVKRGVDVGRMFRLVEAEAAQDRVLLIAGRPARARSWAAAAPWAMMSVSVDNAQAADTLVQDGFDPARTIAWTGTRQHDPALIEALDRAGFRVSFGTLGGTGSFDARIEQSGEDSRYVALAAPGLHVIATDRPMAVRAALQAAARGAAPCTGAAAP